MTKEATEYGKKVEVKNMNSIRNVQRAIDHEVERQMALLDRGERVVSETRTYNPTTGLSQSLRMKEELTDYRYFPEPDLSPVVVTDEWLEEIKANMPPLPSELYEKFISEYGIPEYDAQVLTDSRDMAEYFQAICVHTSNYKAASNWLMGPVKSALNNAGQSIQDFALVPRQLAEVIRLIDEGLISFSIASQKLFPALLEKPDAGVETLASELNLIQKSDSGFIVPVVHEVLAKYPDQVKLYKKGKKGLLGMFMGEVMKRTQGKADPKVASQLLRETLES
jgi:aspartyl-tRNA(Asn)/glutamyl-tRNA(Gln) amidotransferase subunit B